MVDLAPASVWTPAREDDRHLGRTILSIDPGAGGERVSYMDVHAERITSCTSNTFRQWVAKMRCCRTIDRELLEILCEERES